MPKARTKPEPVTDRPTTWTGLLAAELCGDCYGPLYVTAERRFGVRLRPGGAQYPVCITCKHKAPPPVSSDSRPRSNR